MEPPQPPETYGPQDLARDLQFLLELPTQTKSELSAWYEEAFAVQRRISSSEALHDVIPHSLWHFFSDADIRAKEPVIRDMQFEQVRRHIAVLETGTIPPDDSKAVSLGTLFQELWRSIRGKAPPE